MYSTPRLRALLLFGAFMYGLLLPDQKPAVLRDLHHFGAESAEI